MRILFTSDPEVEVPPIQYGGVQRLTDAVLRYMKEQGHEVGLVARPGSTAPAERFWEWPGLESQRHLDTLRNSVTLFNAVRSYRPDLIHSFSRLLYMLPCLPSKLPKMMTYGRYPGKRQVSYASALAGGSLLFTGCSNHIRDTGKLGGGNWHTVYNFVELDLFTFEPEVSQSAPLVFLSRLDRIKGAHTAIAVAKATDQKLIIAGNRTETKEGREYWAELEPLIDGDQITYVGPVNDKEKNELLGSASAMIVPIEWEEPFGIVFIESLACGTPVISTPRGAVPEIIEHGKHGFICSSIDEMAAAVARLRDLSRGECRERVERSFTSQQICGEYEKLYLQMLERK